ncbi:hypothetical protein COO60DRAFT_1284604 [Scenedesmus sp. NREL 46B-D3]|nr:hypothetical protein COO60DRAFT_1284604 [Scenedesmus sp. NREL 46B-D3]
MPGQPAPPGQPWPPGMAPAGQQQQQQAGGLVQLQPLPPHAFDGELQPWMLWYTHGATRAVNELVEDEQMREQVLERGVRCAPDIEVAPFLRRIVMDYMKLMVKGRERAPDSFIKLGELVDRAVADGPHPPPPVPSPAPQPAPVASLPPHLQRNYQQQQQPASTHMLPPHLQHHHAPPQQQQPLWQAEMQQQPAGDDDSDDDDGLMNLLTGSASGATAAAGAQQQPAWGGAAGAQQQGGSGAGSDFPSLGVERGSGGGRRAAAPGVSNAGLANETGEYNCFLNVVVQCLYNCRDFRNSVWELAAHEAEHPVVVALRKLFMDMQQAESGWQPGGERAVVNPTALREALDSVTQFKQQEMNDANELLDTLYECFKKAQNSPGEEGSRGVLVDSVFGLSVKEEVNCRQPGCGKRTHVIGLHWEHLLVVNTMALTFAAYGIPEGASDMGRLLRTLFDQEQKMCDKDIGGCGTAYPPERSCQMAPRVLTLQLVWNQDVKSDEIGSALQHVQENVDISPLYAGGCEVAATTYQLSSAVAYYGQHYMAFVHNTKLNTWLLFDDASVSVVGGWQDVIKKCTAGKIQPSVLFYQTVDLAAVGTGARLPAAQGMPQTHHAPARMSASMPPGAPGGAVWARAAAAAMPAGVPPHIAMPAHLQQQQQQQPHQLYQQPHQLYQQPHMQQQPVPAAPYSQPQQQQQQQQQLGAPGGGSGGWPAAAPAAQPGGMGAGDGSGPGGSWNTVQQPADAGAAWGSAPPSAAPAAAAQPHPAAGGAPAAAGAPAVHQGAAAAQQSPTKVAWGGAAARGGGSMAAAAIRDATGQAGRPGGPSAAPGGGRGSGGPRTTDPPAASGRAEGPHGGRGHAGRGRG